MNTRKKSLKIVLFRLENTNYAIIIDNVFEIISSPPPAPVPMINPFISGAVDFNGRIIPVYNLRSLLGHPENSSSESSNLIVLNYDGRFLGLGIDAVRDVLTMPRLRFCTVILKNYNSAIEGVGEIEGRTFFLLNTEKIIDSRDPFDHEVKDLILQRFQERGHEKNTD